jgi:dihydrodipicolinate synthase/N-acetylneuraminate lyase
VTEFEKSWIDKATYKEILAKIRFEPISSPWMVGETGKYFMSRYAELRKGISDAEHTATSKAIGWGGES